MLLSETDTSSTKLSSGPSTSPRASSSAARQLSAPSYLSARSADVILSEVRPTRIKSEALRSVNVLLDELLWLILGCARSFATDRLRTGLLKVLPTALGQDALLEAEVELRAHLERSPPAEPLPTDEATIQQFPLQQAFELLRIKCEAYCSLGDQEENIENETSLHARMMQVNGDATPKFAAVAPAALYLTAILEHVCEHVLSNVGRVVTRDSSRSTAHSQDLYIALCEDESIYSLFKTMKVQEQIEQQAKTVRPRRSRSFSRNDLVTETLGSGTSIDTPAVPKQRQSVDSSVSNGSNPTSPTRSSVEKGRSKVIFKTPSRTGGSNGSTNHTDAKHHRANSLLGDKKISLTLPETIDPNPEISPDDDDGSVQDFDDLMRSGTTMKVSLTPARLKTFEVFAKEKNQRANRSVLPPSASTSASSPPSSFPGSHKSNQPSRTRNPVESIAEAPEGEPVRLRAASITDSTPSKVDKPFNTPRSRSFTDARAPSVSYPNPKRQSDSSEAPPTSTQTMLTTMVDSSATTPKSARRQPARNRDSLDLDDLMDGLEDDIPERRKTALMPKSAQTTTSGTRELLEFLSEGPPEPPSIVTTPSNSPISPDSRGAKQGRFRTIVSRLTGGSSNERLSPRSDESFVDSNQRSPIQGVNGNSAVSRGPLLSRRSVPNVAATARPMPPTNTSSYPESTIPTLGSRTRQSSLVRKAVPPWEGSQEKADPPTPPKIVQRQEDATGTMKPLPRPTMPSTTQAFPDTSTDSTSPIRPHGPREVEQQARRSIVTDTTPSSPITSLPRTVSINGHVNVDQEPIKATPRELSKLDHDVSTGATLSIIAGDHIQDLRRLMLRATSADECRVLVDMFLARCGALPKDEAQLSIPITPPVSPVRIQPDRHEASLVEALLGDSSGPRALESPTSNPTKDIIMDTIESHTFQRQKTPTLTVTPSAVTDTMAEVTISN